MIVFEITPKPKADNVSIIKKILWYVQGEGYSLTLDCFSGVIT